MITVALIVQWRALLHTSTLQWILKRKKRLWYYNFYCCRYLIYIHWCSLWGNLPWECNHTWAMTLCSMRRKRVFGERKMMKICVVPNTIYNLFCGFPALLHCDSNSVFHCIAKHQKERCDTQCRLAGLFYICGNIIWCTYIELWPRRVTMWEPYVAVLYPDGNGKGLCAITKKGIAGIEREHQWGCDKLEKRAPTSLQLQLHDRSVGPVDLFGSNVQCSCLVAVKNHPAINMRFQLNLQPSSTPNQQISLLTFRLFLHIIITQMTISAFLCLLCILWQLTLNSAPLSI